MDHYDESALVKAGRLLLVGNLLDALFTFVLLQLHVVSEANPLMRWVYELSPLSFMIVKLSCVQCGLLVLWVKRHVPAAGLAIRVAAGIYTVVVVYHLTLIAQLSA